MEFHKTSIEQCELARGIEGEFGTDKALSYLSGEKFLNYIEAADQHAEFRAELPAFVAEIKTIFERWQLAEYLEKAWVTETFRRNRLRGRRSPEIEEARQEDIRYGIVICFS